MGYMRSLEPTYDIYAFATRLRGTGRPSGSSFVCSIGYVARDGSRRLTRSSTGYKDVTIQTERKQ